MARLCAEHVNRLLWGWCYGHDKKWRKRCQRRECNEAGESWKLALTEFYKNKSNKDGRDEYCQTCRKAVKK